MFRQTHLFTVAAAVALSIAAAPTFAATVSYDFSTVNGQSFGAGATGSVTVGNATFTQANASTASYAFSFGPNAGVFSNIDNGGGYVLSSAGGAGAAPTTNAPASVTISFASAVYGINFNYGNSDFFGVDGGDTLTATISGATVATGAPTLNPNGDYYPEAAFSYLNPNGFTSITLTSTDAAGAQDLVLGDLTAQTTPVPLPASIWLLAGGLAALGFKPRRRAA
jgi:hypothetical protein